MRDKVFQAVSSALLSRRTAIAALSAPLWPGVARATDFPARPLKIVVPFTPGGVGAIFARLAGDVMAKDLGQPVVVENKAGANQMLAASAVTHAAPDGLTLYQATSTAILNPLLYKKLAYDPQALKPLWIGLETPLIFIVNPKVPAINLAEFVAYARSNRGKLNYSSIGAGNVLHLAMEKLKATAGIEITHVPYAGRSGDAINAVVAGDVQIMATIVSQAVPLVQAGRLRALAVTSAQRLAAIPDVATVTESGFADLAVASWYGLYVHAATSDNIAQRLRDAADKALGDARFRQTFISTGAVIPPVRSGAEVRRYVEENTRYWADLIREQKLTLSME